MPGRRRLSEAEILIFTGMTVEEFEAFLEQGGYYERYPQDRRLYRESRAPRAEPLPAQG